MGEAAGLDWQQCRRGAMRRDVHLCGQIVDAVMGVWEGAVGVHSIAVV